jgi:hypothetical protein
MSNSRFVISMMVGTKNGDGEIQRYKKVTLATYYHVNRDECSKLLRDFTCYNDHINANEVTGQYFTQEFINPRG